MLSIVSIAELIEYHTLLQNAPIYNKFILLCIKIKQQTCYASSPFFFSVEHLPLQSSDTQSPNISMDRAHLH